MKVHLKERTRFYSRVYERHMNKKYGMFTWPSETSFLDKVIDKIDNYLQGFYNFLARFSKPKCKIEVSGSDVMNADMTMALLIVSVMRKLKEEHYTVGNIEDDDAPSGMDFSERYNWVIDEIIWAFEYSYNGLVYKAKTKEERKANYERAKNGRQLFAKYFETFWI